MNPVAQIRHVDDHGVRYDALAFICPGCALDGSSGLHMLPVNTSEHKPSWTWDGNLEAPTCTPSILTKWGRVDPGDPESPPTFVCHSYLTAGVFEYLSDCTHAFAGEHVPLPPLPDWILDD